MCTLRLFEQKYVKQLCPKLQGTKTVKPFNNLQDIFVKFIKFCGVGVIATLCHYIVGFVLFEFGNIEAHWSAFWGAVIGAIVSYFLNRSITFQSDQSHTETTWRFAIVASGGAFFTWVFMKFLTSFFQTLVGSNQLGYLIAQGVTTILVLLWTFPVNLLWTFAENRKK